MTVTPTGDPLWARTADHTIYGGHADKANYQSQGAINPKTDVTAEEFSRMVEDLAMVGRVLGFCKLKVTCNDSSPAAPTFDWVNMMTGIRSTSYAGDSPPTGFPSGARLGDGSITITFASSYSDAYGVSEAFTPEWADPRGASTSTAHCTYLISGNVVTVSAFDSSSTADADAEMIVEVG
jgi:hypothetical protein